MVAPLFDTFNGTECSVDCDTDEDCLPGLQCADQHGQELLQAGLDKRTAYCGLVGEKVEEVCYDPKNIIGPCDGACCFTRNFDDLAPFDFVEIPAFYKGLLWDNLYVHKKPEEGEFGYLTGYYYGTTSLPNSMFNGYGETGQITALSPKRTFSMRSFKITPVFYDFVEMNATAYDSSYNVLATVTKTLSTTSDPMLVKFGKDFKDIYAFTISTFTTGNLSHVAIDNMRICY